MAMEHERPGAHRRPGMMGGEGRGEEHGGLRGKAEEAGERVKERAGRMAEETKHQAAGRMEEAGRRMDEKAREFEHQGGMKAKAGEAMHRASDTVERGAGYLRSHDADQMRSDLEARIREQPLMSAGIALGAGFLLGRLLG